MVDDAGQIAHHGFLPDHDASRKARASGRELQVSNIVCFNDRQLGFPIGKFFEIAWIADKLDVVSFDCFQ